MMYRSACWILAISILVSAFTTVACVECWYCGYGDMGGGIDENLENEGCKDDHVDLGSVTCLTGFDRCGVKVRYDYLGRIEALRRVCASADICAGIAACTTENPVNSICMECCHGDRCNSEIPSYSGSVCVGTFLSPSAAMATLFMLMTFILLL